MGKSEQIIRSAACYFCRKTFGEPELCSGGTPTAGKGCRVFAGPGDIYIVICDGCFTKGDSPFRFVYGSGKPIGRSHRHVLGPPVWIEDTPAYDEREGLPW